MPAIILTHRWRRQPPPGVALDLSHPIASAASELYSFNSPLAYTRPLKGRNALSKTGTVTFDTRLPGHCERGDATTGILRHSSLSVSAWPFGIGAIVTAPAVPAAASTIVSFGDGSAVSTFGYAYFGTDGTLSATVRTQAGGTIATIAGPTVTPGQAYSCVFVSRSSTQHELWVNGRKYTSSTNTGIFGLYGRFSILALDRFGTLANFGNSMVHAAWHSVLALSEFAYAEWTLDPWAMFVPIQRRIWISAAADHSATLSGLVAAAAVNDLTASVSIAETLSELSAVAAVASLTVDVTSDAEASLTGLIANAAVGDLSADIVGDSLTVALTGVASSSALGTISASVETADSVSLAGLSAAAALGALTVTETANYTETLNEVSADSTVSSLIVVEGLAEALTGLSAAGELADLIADISGDASVILDALSASGAVDSLQTDLETSFSVMLIGLSALARVRDLHIPEAALLIDEAIRAALAPLVQGHVYPLRRPQRTDQKQANAYLPEIVYTIVSDDWQQAETLCGVGLHNTRVQIDVYAGHYREARAFAYAAAEQMDSLGWRINMQPFPDDDERIYRWQLEYSCWRNEAPPSLPLISTHRG